MPDYEYKLKNGKTLVLSGDIQPTDEEVESIAAEQKLELDLADQAEPVTQQSVQPAVPPEQMQEFKGSFNASSPGYAQHESEIVKEPDTYWGGFRKGLGDYVKDIGSSTMEMLESAAHPQTTSDMLNLLVMGDAPAIAAQIPKAIKGKLSEIGNRMRGKTPGVLETVDDITPPIKQAAEVVDKPLTPPATPKTELRSDDWTAEFAKPKNFSDKKPFDPSKLVFGKSKAELTPQQQANEILAGAGSQPPKPPVKPPVAGSSSGEPPIPPDKIPDEIQKLNRSYEAAKLAQPKIKETLYRKIMDTQQALLTGFDISFLGRQGRGLITHRAYWTSIDDMFKAMGSDKASKLVTKSITNHPSGYFKPKEVYVRNNKGQLVLDKITKLPKKELQPSYAERVGLDLTDISSRREEGMYSNWASTGGSIPYLSKGYENTAGRLYRATNRGNIAFINKAASDTFASLLDEIRRRGIDPEMDLVLGRKIANSINVSRGRGSFGKLEHPTLNLDTKEIEQSGVMKVLNEIFLAPKFMKSRVDMYTRVLNPMTYWNTDPVIRKEALRSLFGVAGSALLIQELARLVGAQIINDPRSPDFRKVKVGNTRMDNMAGLQQYGVGATQFLTGKTTSSTDNKTRDLYGGFGDSKRSFGVRTTADVVGNFLVNRTKLIPSMIIAWMKGTDFDGKPFEFKKALANRIYPLVAQDIYELAEEDPKLLPFAIAPIVGEGLQTYGR